MYSFKFENSMTNSEDPDQMPSDLDIQFAKVRFAVFNRIRVKNTLRIL